MGLLRPRPGRGSRLGIRPGGEIADTVSTAGGFNCFVAALGGANGRTLFLCSNPAELDPEVRKNNPQGEIQSFRVDVPLARCMTAIA